MLACIDVCLHAQVCGERKLCYGGVWRGRELRHVLLACIGVFGERERPTRAAMETAMTLVFLGRCSNRGVLISQRT
jgi:hypothetical protein